MKAVIAGNPPHCAWFEFGRAGREKGNYCPDMLQGQHLHESSVHIWLQQPALVAQPITSQPMGSVSSSHLRAGHGHAGTRNLRLLEELFPSPAVAADVEWSLTLSDLVFLFVK